MNPFMATESSPGMRPWAQRIAIPTTDAAAFSERAVLASVVPEQALFIDALRRQLLRRLLTVPPINARPGGERRAPRLPPGARRGARSTSGLDRAERAARRLGVLVAIAAAGTALPGMIRVVRERGPASGRPELVFTPLRLLLISAGWFGAAAASWQPIPVSPGHRARWMLLAMGLGLYMSGMGLAVSGRLALGSSYRPSSTLGATLAPKHRLVSSGPFAIVRHPMYLGLALAAFGALAVYRTWSTVLFVVQVPVLVVRAHREEELLARAFGDAWDRYAARVPAWLPRRPRRPRVALPETGHADGDRRCATGAAAGWLPR